MSERNCENCENYEEREEPTAFDKAWELIKIEHEVETDCYSCSHNKAICLYGWQARGEADMVAAGKVFYQINDIYRASAVVMAIDKLNAEK